MVLARMAELLYAGGGKDWALVLEKFHGEITNNPTVISARILSMFGGMGSLNDIILYRNGQPLAQENSEFDTLRSKLYELCHE